MSKKEIPALLSETILKGKLIGKSGSEREIIGGSTHNNLLTIQGIMDCERPRYTLEIGMAYGISAMLFAMKHKELNNGAQQHYSIDPFQISHWDGCGLLLLEKNELLKYVNYFEAFSAIQLPKWVESKLKFDLIYIDGSHLFEDVFIDYYYCAQLMNTNGIMLFDDCRDPHVLKVIKFIKNNMADYFEEIDLNQYLGREGSELLKYKLAVKLDKIQLRGFVKKKDDVNRKWDSTFLNF